MRPERDCHDVERLHAAYMQAEIKRAVGGRKSSTGRNIRVVGGQELDMLSLPKDTGGMSKTTKTTKVHDGNQSAE